MKSWQEALRILLIEIDLSVAELARVTGTNHTSIYKFFQGKNNGTTKTMQTWLEACERHHQGSWKIFHLICADSQEQARLKSEVAIQDHVEAMSAEELADYLKAIANRLRKDIKKTESCAQPEEVSLPEPCEPELTEPQSLT